MKLAKADLLILDDLGLGHLDEAQRHDLLEVLEGLDLAGARRRPRWEPRRTAA